MNENSKHKEANNNAVKGIHPASYSSARFSVAPMLDGADFNVTD